MFIQPSSPGYKMKLEESERRVIYRENSLIVQRIPYILLFFFLYMKFYYVPNSSEMRTWPFRKFRPTLAHGTKSHKNSCREREREKSARLIFRLDSPRRVIPTRCCRWNSLKSKKIKQGGKKKNESGVSVRREAGVSLYEDTRNTLLRVLRPHQILIAWVTQQAACQDTTRQPGARK